MKTDTCRNTGQGPLDGAEPPAEVVHEYMKRVCNHNEEDKADFLLLVTHLLTKCKPDTEEFEQTLRSMDEIVDGGRFAVGSGRVLAMEFPTPAEIETGGDAVRPATEPLRTWVSYISKQIRSRREKASLTQEQLAERAGIPQSHLSRIENGVHSPAHKTLRKIAAALGIQYEELDPR